MTPFDWSELLVVAGELASRTGDEAAARTAINRAYYSAFGMARRHLIGQGIAVQQHGAAHVFVWTTFHNTPGRVNHRIANLGRRLLSRRRRADYDDLFPDLDRESRKAVAWTRRLLADLATLP